MSFQILTTTQSLPQGEQPVMVLTDGTARAEVWPGMGFNCLRWSIGDLKMLYTAPDWATNPVPTRSGIPVLFPFPNRIRGGRFSFSGRDWPLPLNCAKKANAIHGWACRNPWRVVDSQTTATSASITGEFQASIDAPAIAKLWPADYRLRITITLLSDALVYSTLIENPDSTPLPCGLGFHPYFAVPFSGSDLSSVMAAFPGPTLWESEDNLPTGRKIPVGAGQDLRTPRPYSELQLDDLYTDLTAREGGIDCGYLEQAGVGRLELIASRDFRELVAFTPTHRQALCLEPYSCATDAVNLQAPGLDAGWWVLAPGEVRPTEVVYRFIKS